MKEYVVSRFYNDLIIKIRSSALKNSKMFVTGFRLIKRFN